jgi:hypothetical protein
VTAAAGETVVAVNDEFFSIVFSEVVFILSGIATDVVTAVAVAIEVKLVLEEATEEDEDGVELTVLGAGRGRPMALAAHEFGGGNLTGTTGAGGGRAD